MAFDQNDPRPTTLTTHKKTTKVNIGVVVGVLVFFAVAAGALSWMWMNQAETTRDVHESASQPAR